MAFTGFSIWFSMLLVYSVSFFVVNELVPSVVKNLPDLGGVVVFIAFILESLRGRGFQLPVKYAVYAMLLMLLVCFSAIVNNQSSGSIILGVKNYFIYIPFFLLPFAYSFSQAEIRKYLYAMLGIALFQVPLAMYQRFVQFADRMHNGDIINGTLGISSFLSIFLICAIALLLGFYMRKRLGLGLLACLMLFLFLPTTVNETKGTLIILPLAILAPAIANAIHTGSIRSLIPIGMLGCILVIGFLFIFSQFEKQVFGRELGEQDMMKYTFQDKDIEERSAEAPVIGKLRLNREQEVGRGDSMLLPFKVLSKDFFSIAFGVGIGNASETSIDLLAGDFKKYEHLKPDYTVISRVTWELGVLGLVAAFAIVVMVAWDAFIVASRQDYIGAFALGWLGVVAVVAFSMTYKELIYGNVISMFFWFFCGYVSSQRVGQGSN